MAMPFGGPPVVGVSLEWGLGLIGSHWFTDGML